MGAARDIVESAGVARFWFSDFPLGHSAGKPFDEASQFETVRGALRLFEDATEPNTTVQSSQVWADSDGWQADFMDVSKLDPEKLARLRAEHEQVRAMKAAEPDDTRS